MVLGNKCDDEENRKVDLYVVEKYCQEHKLKHLQVSAKSGHQVIDAFASVS